MGKMNKSDLIENFKDSFLRLKEQRHEIKEKNWNE